MASFFDKSIDAAIVRKAQHGDMKAHEMIFKTYSPAVYTVARRLVRRPEIADEILQDTFIEVLTRISQFRNEAPIGAWIRKIAVNKSLMYLRSYWQRFGEGLEPGWEDRQENQPPDVAAKLCDKLDLNQALEMLPAVSRAVMWLHEVEGYTHEEIAAQMGKSASFSKSQLARAYKRLRTLLDNDIEVQSCMPLQSNC
ncbi:MAG: sigma-70 family RNA polymerase sigma factor [Gammaproteobacteria bacterium]|nr:sigma-70 family RNA polymerase sigma factor [Gammaproteobacteria bacterium]